MRAVLKVRKVSYSALVSLFLTIFSFTQMPTASAIDLPLTIAPDQTSGYERTLFKHWIDADKDKCDTRKEVLILEAVKQPTLGSGCSIIGGKWISPYDERITSDPTTLDIDHLVPLAEAWRSGAWKWSAAQRQAFANDLTDDRALIAVTSGLNREKSDQDPSTWLPPVGRCTYISNWISIKIRYSLTVDPAEAAKLNEMIATCNITFFTATQLAGYNGTNTAQTISLGTPAPTPSAIATPESAAKKVPNKKYASCAKARAAGVTPIKRSTNRTLYNLNKALDANKDGIACS
jgi:hypothetical protein